MYSFFFQFDSLHFNLASCIKKIYIHVYKVRNIITKIVIRLTPSAILPETYPQIKTVPDRPVNSESTAALSVFISSEG